MVLLLVLVVVLVECQARVGVSGWESWRVWVARKVCLSETTVGGAGAIFGSCFLYFGCCEVLRLVLSVCCFGECELS